MAQAQIELTTEEIAALEALAKKRKVSLSDLIHEGIDHLLRTGDISGKAECKQRALAVSGRFRSGLKDLATGHDDYLAEIQDR